MEFVSGYRDRLVEYSEVLFSWYRRYLSDCGGRLDRDVGSDHQEKQLKALSCDASCWFLHVLHNDRIAFQPRDPDQQNHDGFYADDVLRCGDLEKYVRLIDAEGEHEMRGSEAGDLQRIEHLLIVAEDSGDVLGVDFVTAGRKGQPMLGARACRLLYQCMQRPMVGGGPRQPSRVAVGEPSLLSFLTEHMSAIGVCVHQEPLRGWAPNANFLFSGWMPHRCHVCRKRGFEATLTACDKCDAVLYCSDTCKIQDWRRDPRDISHAHWCDRMKNYMQGEAELAQLPFYFSREVTSRTFDKEWFLSSRKLTGGCWSSESIHHFTSLFKIQKLDTTLEGGSEYFEPMSNVEPFLKQQPKERLRSPVETWKEYYAWRGISLNNSIAALLTYPLTVYHIISKMVPQHFPDLNVVNKRSLKIHIIEARMELRNLLLFWELAVLMPQVTLELVLVGSDLPPEMDERSLIIHKEGGDVICSDVSFSANERLRGIQVKVHARPYHSLQVAKPDIVIGFNSGFGLDDSWLSTLPRLQAMKVAAYFSDCSQYSCEVDGQVVGMATGGTISPPMLNPFRSPLRIFAADNNMPWYNNAFLFYLIYKTTQNTPRKRNNYAPPTHAVPATPPAESGTRRKMKQGQRNQGRKRK
ncbi:zinc finger MYND domain-containing protein 15 [Hyperolius riggenbachi]|uniref:zinc finger MYND domain-containing protein 15 n=1 Tax=Hyperolius riggenbachi TaxID=752182 RepID=UPI0035A337C2